MKLTQLLGVDTLATAIILVGKPEITNILDSEEKPYWVVQLKDEITVRCSVDKDIEPFQTKEVYVRQEAIESEDWQFVDETKPEQGFFMKDWKVDFSKGQEIPIYQSTTIAKWAKDNRSSRVADRRTGINARIRERMERKAGN